MSLRVLIYGLLLGLSPALPAEDNNPPDFSEGLEDLAKLGLPDMAGAVWEKAPEPLQRSNYLQDWEFRELNARIKGGAWKLADEQGKFLAFATGSPTLIKSETSEDTAASENILQKMARNFKKQNPSDAPKKPKPLMIKGDVEALIEALETPKARKEIQSKLRYRGAEVPGRCLIFAAQIHASGEKELANRVATAVFEAVPDRTIVIDAAVSHFADSELNEINTDFFSHHDWKEYHEKLSALAAKYPRGWGNRLALALLIPNVEARLKQLTIATPSLPGIPLKKEALALLNEWVAKPSDPNDDSLDLEKMAVANGIDLSKIPAEYRAQLFASLQQRQFGVNSSGDGIWLLPKTDDSEGNDDATPSGPVSGIKELGMDGLIAIASVTTDETLTHIRNPGSRGSSYSSNESTAEKAMRAYANMTRPLTRGEIAVSLLTAVIPDFESGNGNQEDAQLIQESAIEFWKQNREKMPIDLAGVYLKEGSDSQRTLAANFLSQCKDPAAAPAFEKAVLKSDDILQFTSLIPRYLQLKKSKALPFFNQYSKQLTDALDGIDDDKLSYSSGGWAIKEAGGVEAYLRKIGIAVGASSVDDLIADALKTDASNNHYPQLLEGIESIPVKDLLPAFGKAISTADPTTKFTLLQTLAYRSSRADDDGASLFKNEPFPDDLAKLWIPIVEDETLIETDDSETNWFSHYDCHTIGTAAALTLEFMMQEVVYDYVNRYTSVHFDDDTFPAFIAKRSLARIKGEPLTLYPSAKQISEDRRKEIVAMAETHTGLELKTKVIALDSDERAAWLEWWGSLSEEESDAPSSILDLRTLITGHVKPSAKDYPNPDPELLKSLDLDSGSKIDAAKLEKIANELLEQAEEKSGTMILLKNAPLWLGLEVVAFRPAKDGANQNRTSLGYLMSIFKSDKVGEAKALVLLSPTSQRNLYLCLGIADGMITPVDFGNGETESFATRFEEVLAQNGPNSLSFSIAVLTREDFNKQQNQE